MSDVTVEHRPDDQRYEAMIGGDVAGYVSYEFGDGVIDLQHTVVDDSFGGRGVGGTLVRSVLDDVRDQGERKVIPTCPFIKSWIGKHPEYADLRAEG